MMSSEATKSSKDSTGAASSKPRLPPHKGFVLSLGIEGSDPNEVVRSLVQLRKEKGWSSRLFALHSLRGSEGLYEEWCERMSNEVKRLTIASVGVAVPRKDESADEWTKTVPGQFDDVDNS